MHPDPVIAMLDGVDWPLYELKNEASGYIAGAGSVRDGTSVVRIDHTGPSLAQRLIVQTHRDDRAGEVDLAHVAEEVRSVAAEGAPLGTRPNREVVSFPATTIEVDGRLVPARTYDDGMTKVVVADLQHGMVIVVGDSCPDGWKLVRVADVEMMLRRRAVIVAEYRKRLAREE